MRFLQVVIYGAGVLLRRIFAVRRSQNRLDLRCERTSQAAPIAKFPLTT